MAFVQDLKDFEGGKPATMVGPSEASGDFVFRSTKLSSEASQSRSNHHLEEIAMFSVEAGDELDLTEIASHFDMSPEEAVAALRLTSQGSATLVSILAGNYTHDMVLLHGVSPTVLRAARPWVFNAAAEDVLERFECPDEKTEEASVGTLVLGEPLEPEHLYLKREKVEAPDQSVCPLADAFIFDDAAPSEVPTARQAPTQTDISNAAGALGVSQSQVLEALHAQMKGGGDGQAQSADALASALNDADKLVV